MSTVLHKELALFDLDNTLIDTDSDYMWGEFLVKHNLVEESLYRAKIGSFMSTISQERSMRSSIMSLWQAF